MKSGLNFLLFLLWAFILLGRPQELFPLLGKFRPALTLTGLSVFLTFANVSKGEVDCLLSRRDVKRYLFFFIIMIIGIPFAYHRRLAFDYVSQMYLINILFFLVFLMNVNTLERLERFMTVVVFSTLFYSIFTLLYGRFVEGRYVSYSTMYDPNDIAYVLISTFPISIYFIISRSKPLLKYLSLVSVFASTAVILLTGSRAGLLGLSAVFILLIFMKTEKFGPAHKGFIILLAAAAIFLYSSTINFNRLETITDFKSDYNVTDEFGRLMIWQRAWELLLKNPITGVGVNCFPMAVGYYRDVIGVIPKWQVTHNSYVQIAAETGFIGIIVFMTIIFRSMMEFISSLKNSVSTRNGTKIKTISAVLLMGYTGHLITAFFLSQGYSIFFTTFFALAVTTNRLRISERRLQDFSGEELQADVNASGLRYEHFGAATR